MAVEVHMLAPNGLRKQESRRRELPTSRERLDGWVVAGYGCDHIGSPGCRAGTLGRRDALPVARENPHTAVCGLGVEGVRIEPPARQLLSMGC